MGHAAYMRGNAVISRQIQDEAAATRLVSIDRHDLATIEDDRERLRAENARLTTENKRLRLCLRERRATVEAERYQHSEDMARMTERAHSAERSMLAFRRRWEWVSRLLRMVASPAAVADARAELLAVEQGEA